MLGTVLFPPPFTGEAGLVSFLPRLRGRKEIASRAMTKRSNVGGISPGTGSKVFNLNQQAELFAVKFHRWLEQNFKHNLEGS